MSFTKLYLIYLSTAENNDFICVKFKSLYCLSQSYQMSSKSFLKPMVLVTKYRICCGTTITASGDYTLITNNYQYICINEHYIKINRNTYIGYWNNIGACKHEQTKHNSSVTNTGIILYNVRLIYDFYIKYNIIKYIQSAIDDV